MNYQEATKHLQNINSEVRRTCKTAREAKRFIQLYAKRHGLKYQPGSPAIIHDGSERAIEISDSANGGLHLDVVVSPVFAMLDAFDDVLYL